MKLEMQMTERDKKLLIFLAVFCIVVGIGYWGIYPQIKAIGEINDEMIKAEDKMFVDDMKISELMFLMDENEELEEKIVEAREHFYPAMTSDQIDKMLTGMALSYNLQAYDLDIVMPSSETSLEAYQYSQKYLDDQYVEVEEVSMTDSDEEDSDEDDFDDFDDYDQEASTGIYTVQTSMRLGGNEVDLQRFINDLSVTDDTIHLVSYDWTRENILNYDDETGEFSTESSLGLNISFNIYMYAE